MKSTTALIAIAIFPMVTGSFSIAVSSTIIYKILKSQSKLSNPYNRLLFGLYVFDVILSTCHVASNLPAPRRTQNLWGAIGNDTTCETQGFFMIFSFVSTPFYNLALCVYFLAVIKCSITDRAFSTTLEPYLHALPLLFALVIAIYNLVIGNINSSSYTCFVDVEHEFWKLWITTLGPLVFIFLSMIIIMTIIVWTVYRQEQTIERYRFQLNAEEYLTTRSSIRSQENSSRSRRRVDAVRSRAVCFLSSFVLTYTLPFACVIQASFVGFENVNTILIVFARALLPLQGVFNACAHFQPKIRSLQKEQPQMWYLPAFLAVLKKLNVDLDDRVNPVRNRRSTRLRETIRGAPQGRSPRLN